MEIRLTSNGQTHTIENGFCKKVVVELKILLQIGIVFGLYWVSQCIEAVLPFSFPAGVISLLLLLALLVLKAVKVDHIRAKADFLLGNLSFFFVPVSVSIVNYIDVIRDNAAPFLVICVVSTVLTFAAAAWAVRLTCRLLEKRKGAAE